MCRTSKAVRKLCDHQNKEMTAIFYISPWHNRIIVVSMWVDVAPEKNTHRRWKGGNEDVKYGNCPALGGGVFAHNFVILVVGEKTRTSGSFHWVTFLDQRVYIATEKRNILVIRDNGLSSHESSANLLSNLWNCLSTKIRALHCHANRHEMKF